MGSPALLCTDGSELSLLALEAGIALLAPDVDRLVVVTGIDAPDPALVIGGGHAGPVMSESEYSAAQDAALRGATAIIEETQRRLGLHGSESEVLRGDIGAAICERAEELGAVAIVIGSRGRGGWKRAVLGSVSDHVVRNAPCPVVVVNSGVGVD
jgi:nucleotide-binding universal stress UspA family protein